MILYLVADNMDEVSALLELGYPHIMFSYASAWRLGRFLHRLRSGDLGGLDIIIDSGAFGVMSSISVREYLSRKYLHEYLRFVLSHWRFARFVTPDVPCEPTVPAGPVSERIRLTVERALWLFERVSSEVGEREARRKLIAVIQGLKLSHYYECLDMLREHGLITETVGVGSLCVRKSTEDIATILRGVSRRVSAKIHAFGVDLRAVPRIRGFINSCDTHSWARHVAYGRVVVLRNGVITPLRWSEAGVRSRREALILCAKTYLERFRQLSLGGDPRRIDTWLRSDASLLDFL